MITFKSEVDNMCEGVVSHRERMEFSKICEGKITKDTLKINLG